MQGMMFGSVVLLMGLFGLVISGPLAKLVTNWNLFIHQDLEVLEAYRNKKLRRIRLMAKVWIGLALVFIVSGFFIWILEGA